MTPRHHITCMETCDIFFFFFNNISSHSTKHLQEKYWDNSLQVFSTFCKIALLVFSICDRFVV
jgi:hypothetical protein